MNKYLKLLLNVLMIFNLLKRACIRDGDLLIKVKKYFCFSLVHSRIKFRWGSLEKDLDEGEENPP